MDYTEADLDRAREFCDDTRRDPTSITLQIAALIAQVRRETLEEAAGECVILAAMAERRGEIDARDERMCCAAAIRALKEDSQ